MLSIELQKPRFALIEEAPPGDERQALLVQLFAVNLFGPNLKTYPWVKYVATGAAAVRVQGQGGGQSTSARDSFLVRFAGFANNACMIDMV